MITAQPWSLLSKSQGESQRVDIIAPPKTSMFLEDYTTSPRAGNQKGDNIPISRPPISIPHKEQTLSLVSLVQLFSRFQILIHQPLQPLHPYPVSKPPNSGIRGSGTLA